MVAFARLWVSMFLAASCSLTFAFLPVQFVGRGAHGVTIPLACTDAEVGTKKNEEEIMTACQTRRGILGATICALVGTFADQQPACAKYGDSSNMELPNYIEYLLEKNAQGSAAGGALYRGADPVVLLRRLQEADNRLKEIPQLANEKKWSQVQGVLTGPLGTLSQTLNQIATPDSDKQVQTASKKLKADLIDIGQAAAKKNAEACVAKAGEASKDLVSFLELAFE